MRQPVLTTRSVSAYLWKRAPLGRAAAMGPAMSHAIAYAPTMTVDEFLVWPGDGLNRSHALIDGVPLAMNPAALAHGLIAGELTILIGVHLRAARPHCRILVEPGVRPRAGSANNVRIPDLAVACGPLGDRLLANPLLLIEILSPSNLRETREAVRACLTIPSLREVLVVDSEAIGAELLTRLSDGLWPEDPTRMGPGDDLMLDSIGLRVPLAALYAGTCNSTG